MLRREPIRSVPASSGQRMYVSYCAVCHGATAKGDGPAAPALKTKPTDLSALAARNAGTFPKFRVMYVLTAVEDSPVRGSAEMPKWCPAFRSVDHDDMAVVTLRARNLVGYLRTLQVPAQNDAVTEVAGGHRR